MKFQSGFFLPFFGLVFTTLLFGCGGGSDSGDMGKEKNSSNATVAKVALSAPSCSERNLSIIKEKIENKIETDGSDLVVGFSDLSFNSGANGEYWYAHAKSREGDVRALVVYRCDGGVDILNE